MTISRYLISIAFMNLQTWQKAQKISNAELALMIGVHFSYITYLHNGKRRPSPELAEKIEQATGGQVSRLELLYPEKQGVDNQVR